MCVRARVCVHIFSKLIQIISIISCITSELELATQNIAKAKFKATF